MQFFIALLLAVIVFEEEFYKGTAVPATPTTGDPAFVGTPESSDVAGDEIPVETKKFVPALFFKTNWFRAYQYCRFHGMHLASPESQEEEKQLISALEKSGLGEKGLSFWTSGNDLACEGDFVWMSSGKMMTYNNWSKSTSEPNGGTTENCVVLVNGSSGLYWNDISCSYNRHFACEYFENNVDDLTPARKQLLTEYV